MTRHRAREVVKKGAYVALSALLLALWVEFLLRAAAVVIPRLEPESPAAGNDGAPDPATSRILWYGGSYTGGTDSGPDHRYPAYAESLLNERDRPHRWSVLNRAALRPGGVIDAASRFPADAAKFRPRWVIINLNFRDTRLRSVRPGLAGLWGKVTWGLAGMRVVRLAAEVRVHVRDRWAPIFLGRLTDENFRPLMSGGPGQRAVETMLLDLLDQENTQGTHLLAARFYSDVFDIPRATLHLRRALSLGADPAVVHRKLANCYFQASQPALVEKHLLLSGKATATADNLVFYSRIREKRGDLKQAESLLRQAARLEDSPGILLALTEFYNRREDFAAVERLARTAFAAQNSPRLWVALAESRRLAGRIAEMEEPLRRAAALSDSWGVRMHLVQWLRRQNRVDEASEVERRARVDQRARSDNRNILAPGTGTPGVPASVAVYWDPLRQAMATLAVQAERAGVRVILENTGLNNRGPNNDTFLTRVAKEEAARLGWTFIDVQSLFVTHPRRYDFLGVTTHLNSDGNRWTAEVIVDRLLETPGKGPDAARPSGRSEDGRPGT